MIPQVGQTVRRKNWDRDAAVRVIAVANKTFIGQDSRDGTESLYVLDVGPARWEWEEVRYVPEVGDRVRLATWVNNGSSSVRVTAIGETSFLAVDTISEVQYPLDKNWIKL